MPPDIDAIGSKGTNLHHYPQSRPYCTRTQKGTSYLLMNKLVTKAKIKRTYCIILIRSNTWEK